LVSDPEERRAFATAVRGQIERDWGGPSSAKSGDLTAIANSARKQGWMDLGSEGALGLLLPLMDELGRAACPLPVHDSFAFAELLYQACSEQMLARGTDGAPLVAVVSEREGFGEGLSEADLVLTVDSKSNTLRIQRPLALDHLPGLSMPPLEKVSDASLAATMECDPRSRSLAVDLLRFAIAGRALGAATSAHEMALEHAKNRKQFGKAIGAFGAVQQRVAHGQVLIEAASALLGEAVNVWESQTPFERTTSLETRVHMNLAARFIRDNAVEILRGAQHTLGAIGYFEEHAVPWLFRRVHTDVLLLDSWEHLGTSTVDVVVDQLGNLPDFALGENAAAIQDEVRSLLARHQRRDDTFDVDALRADCSATGIFSLNWPEEFRGRPATAEMQVVVAEEMKRAGGPVDRSMSASAMIGHAVIAHGSASQKAKYLPIIRRGELAFCLGYSEPEAGSDLASLRTRADWDGNAWKISGQKLWTTRADSASHVWLAVRTNQEAEPHHAGISIFLIPMDTPGISFSEHKALSGEISCTVFYDEVQADDDMRIGDVDGGWKVIVDALASERLIMGGVVGSLLRQLDDFLRIAKAGIIESLRNDRGRSDFTSLLASIQGARALVLAASREKDDRRSRLLSSVAAVFSGDLAEHMTTTLLQLGGLPASLNGSANSHIGSGELEGLARLAPMYVIGGGTNDIQRALIARSLGLPRE